MIIRSSPSRYRTDTGRGAFDWEARREGRSAQVETTVSTAESISTDLIYYDRLQGGKTIAPFGPMVQRDRVMHLDGSVAKISASWLSQELAHGTPLEQEDTGPGGTFARLAELGRRIVRLTEDVTAVGADASAAVLGLEKGVCIFKIVRSAFDAEGRLTEITSETFSPQVYQLQFDVQLEDHCPLFSDGHIEQLAQEIKRRIRE